MDFLAAWKLSKGPTTLGWLWPKFKKPPFTWGKKQLKKVLVDWSHELSAVRNHVGRICSMHRWTVSLFFSFRWSQKPFK